MILELEHIYFFNWERGQRSRVARATLDIVIEVSPDRTELVSLAGDMPTYYSLIRDRLPLEKTRLPRWYFMPELMAEKDDHFNVPAITRVTDLAQYLWMDYKTPLFDRLLAGEKVL